MHNHVTIQQLLALAGAGVHIELKDFTIMDPAPVQDDDRTCQLAERLGWVPRHDWASGMSKMKKPDNITFVATAKVNEDKIAVFMVTDKGHLTLEDDAALFPSDSLITRIRLLEKHLWRPSPDSWA